MPLISITAHTALKSSADCQSWHQCKPSRLSFSIAKATFSRIPQLAKYEGEKTRTADCYVFCHYPEPDKAKVNVLDVSAWDFYVMRTVDLNASFGYARSVC